MKWLVSAFGIVVFVGLIYLVFILFFAPQEPTRYPWLILYSKEANESELENYNLVIFEVDNHPPFENLKEKNIQVYARLDFYSLFNEFAQIQRKQKNQEAVLEWFETIIEEKIPEILVKRFNGLFIDGLQDLPSQLRNWIGVKEVVIQLILLLKIHFPSVPLLVKDAYLFLPQIADTVDGFVGSAITTQYDSFTGQYSFIEPEEHERKIEALKKIKEKYPQLIIYTLDYWDPADKETINKIYQIEEKNHFRPYVGNADLDEIVTS